ncbi:ergothioneine biosynthesis protein EgtC [Actinoplanes sp. NPDC089786]|uniref:ergothioneine biosynthesis protein EgtC n=1 Tax=Actinoplanes sp. NPDC089786 TaxID=3155185 RepID=UPI0034218DEA
MCRHLGYLGPPVPLSAVLFDPPHGLVRQSWAPKDMRGGGTINADGFGIGWYTPNGAVRYRRHTPIWSDLTLAGLAATVTSTTVLAAVRSATVGMPVTETAAAPFGEGPWLFSHNGIVAGWPGSMAKPASALPTTDLLTLDAPTDAALLWAFVRDRLRAGATPADALASVVAEVEPAAPGSRLNMLLTDGTSLAATTAGHSLSVRRRAADVVVASEPFDDDPGWQPVPDRTLLIATAATLTTKTLGEL